MIIRAATRGGLVACVFTASLLGVVGCGPTNSGSGDCDGGSCNPHGIDANAHVIDSGPMVFPDAPPQGHVLVSLTLAPDNPVLFIDNNTPVMQAFTVKGHFADNVDEDVTAMATFTDDKPALGGFTGATFTSLTAGGFTTVTATVGTLRGQTILTLVPRRLDPTTGMPLDFFFIAPYLMDPMPADAILEFGTNIQEADVGFLMDVSGSQQSKIDNLKSALGGLVTSLKMKIPSVGLGVGEFSSWPCGVDGSAGINIPPIVIPGDYPWKLDNRIVTVTGAGLTNVTNSIGSLTAGGSHVGGDSSEDGFDALYFAATGATQSDCGGGTVPAFNAATSPGGAAGEQTGSLGGMGFRAGALPVLVIITDAEFHDIQDPADTTFPTAGLMAHGHTDTLNAIKAIGGHVIGIASTGGGSDFSPIFTGDTIDAAAANPFEPHPQEVWLAQQTGTEVPPSAFAGACGPGMCCTGLNGGPEMPDASGMCPLVYRVDASGSGLGTSLADAVTKLVGFLLFDVSTQIAGKTTDEETPGNPLPTPHTTADFLAPVDAMRGVVPTDSTPAVGTPGGPTGINAATGTFQNVQPGTKVRFKVKVYNDFIQETSVPQFFKANIKVVGDGATLLDQRDVFILVPPTIIVN